MATATGVGTGSGTTAVLGTKLAKTGIEAVRLIWATAAGLASTVTGVAMVGRDRDLTVGRPFDE